MKCRNCGFNIVKVNFATGEKWMHQHEGAAFSDGMYEYCKTAVATPLTERVRPEFDEQLAADLAERAEAKERRV